MNGGGAADAVVHVAPHYPPSLGGLEQVVWQLAAYRRARGLPVEVLTSDDGHARGGAEAGVRRLANRELAHTSLAPGLLPALLRLGPAALVHVHVSQAFWPETTAAAHRLRRFPYVAHVHIDAGPSGGAGFLLRAYKPAVLGPVLRRAAAVVVFTDEQRAELADRYRLVPERVHVVPNGVDVDRFAGPFRPSAAPPRLLFVGRLSAQKQVDVLLRALAGLAAPLPLTLVGDGDRRRGLEALAAELGLPDVVFHGPARGPELVELYRAHDVLVLPSDREGMPLVLLEALAAGLAVVAADIPGNRDVVRAARAGVLFAPGDAGALGAALVDITADTDRLDGLRRGAVAAAGIRSWDAVGDELERLYASIRRPHGA